MGKTRRGKIQRICSLLCALLLFLSGETRAYAADPVDTTLSGVSQTAEEEQQATENAYNMTVDSNELTGWPQGPQTYGEAGIVMDMDSGAILYAKNIDGKAYPASITKVLTMLVALENAEEDQKVTISQDSIDFLEYGDAHIGMTPGEELSLPDALYALMLASANEVAHAIGESEGEGYDWFIEQMNETAQRLGAVNSHFVNTNGLQDENHYTTALDMALIARELFLNYPEFQEISQTLQYTIGPTNLESESRVFQQAHEMFYEGSDHYYPYAVAGKTGYTENAMNTLVTCAEKDGIRLVCVVMKTHGRNVYTDSIALLDYGFSSFQKLDLAGAEESRDISEIEEGAYVMVPEGVDFSNLELTLMENEENPREGTASYTYEGNPVGTATVSFSRSYLEENVPQILEKSDGKKENGLPGWVRFLLTAAGILVALTVLWFFIALAIRRKRRLERRRRRRQRRRRQ